MKNRIKEIHLVILLLALNALLLLIWSVRSKGSIAGADDINHYFIARYSWQFPYLLIDHWGKPLFTLIASPFAQFGNIGTKVMNVILAILSAFFVYRTVKKLEYDNAWLSVIILLFFPVFLVMSLSGNIEILGAFILILSTYFYVDEKPIISNIVLSFLIFVRTETFIFLPIYVLANLLNKQYKAIPFLLTGFLVYSFAGFFYYHDLLWFFTKIPYSNDSANIETDSLFHYINNSKIIFGVLLTPIVGIGLIFFIVTLFKKDIKIISKKNIDQIVIIALPLLAYLAAHSYSYWKGVVGGMSGNVRIMAAVAPLAAIIALAGINNILDLVKFKIIKIVILIAILYFTVTTPGKVYTIPVDDFKDMRLMRRAASWLKGSEYIDNFLVYGDRRFADLLSINPYDKDRSHWYVYSSSKPEQYLPDSTIYIWDAHFSTYFENIHLPDIMENKHFRLINYFEPDSPFKVRGGYDYAIYFFQKISGNNSINNYTILQEFKKKEQSNYTLLGTINFETDSLASANIVDRAYRSHFAYLLDSNEVYSPTIKMPAISIRSIKKYYSLLKADVHILPEQMKPVEDLILIGSYERKGRIFEYYSTQEIVKDSIGEWYRMELNFPVPRLRSKKDEVRVYLYNKGHNKLIMDDLTFWLK